ncbi:MAG: CDC48 family AAA ATPase [Candidatus Hodarchaeota archaeon]
MSSDEIRLRIREANYRDVGKGIARISKAYMKKLEVKSGDVLEIQGSLGKKTTAIVWPAYSADEKKALISIDATTRSNAGVRLDEIVTIKKVSTSTAERIVLKPNTKVVLGNAATYFGQMLKGRPFSLHDKIRLESMGNKIEYTVTKLIPNSDNVVIDDYTIIDVLQDDIDLEKETSEHKLTPMVSYEDIGGLDSSIQRMREMVELPMRYPELFERLGVEAPKGVLLYGPPGTGKTLLAKAVASETESHFILVSGPEIMSKFYGESEQKVREIFDEAKENAPSIIFIDEIDSIAPKRDDKGSGEVERRIVSQMLALMDGLETRGEIIVIGATNRPNTIDPALRRPGRFDREIEIGVPNKEGRLVILGIHTRSMPLDEEVDLNDLASRTHGFVGADLSSLAKEAGMRAIRRIFPKIVWGEELSPNLVSEISVLPEDFNIALAEIKPSALREVFIEVPSVTWNEVGGLDDIKQELKEIIEWPSKYPLLFEYLKTEIPRGVMLIGPPGTGKTLLVRAIANTVSYNFISVKGSEIHSKWIGESERTIQETFRKARLAAPCIIFFDEIDALIPSRTAISSSTGTNERIVTTFLTEMDGLEELKEVIVIAATNRPDILDPALLRPGRFERIIELKLPNESSRKQILEVLTRDTPLSSSIKLAEIAKQSEGFSGADLKGVISLATFSAINRILKEHQVELDKCNPESAAILIKKIKPEVEVSEIMNALNKVRDSLGKNTTSFRTWKK